MAGQERIPGLIHVGTDERVTFKSLHPLEVCSFGNMPTDANDLHFMTCVNNTAGDEIHYSVCTIHGCPGTGDAGPEVVGTTLYFLNEPP